LNVPLERIDTDHLSEQDIAVSLSADEPPDRLGDVGWAQATGCDLVQQRLEEVVVPTVDQRDRHVGVGQLPSGRHPSEAGSDDDDMFSHGHVTSLRNDAPSTVWRLSFAV
jgi:hypothetical protein